MATSRYPGLRSFEEKDSGIFFGREAETKTLAGLMQTERFMVLFGRSGSGKTSLLNTVLKKSELDGQFEKVKVRILNTSDENTVEALQPREMVRRALAEVCEKGDLEQGNILYNKEQPLLWEWVKLAELALKKRTNKKLVLIFDQFEDFFSLDKAVQTAFYSELAEILHEQPPSRVLGWAFALKDEERGKDVFDWYRQPDICVIFSIRSDRLYYFDKMVEAIPNILAYRMELPNFDEENAKDAIEKPAELPGDFSSPEIKYEGNTINKIIESISAPNGDVDTTVLQVILYSVENLAKGADKVFPLTENDFESEEDKLEGKEDNVKSKLILRDVMSKFYLDQTEVSNDSNASEELRVFIEDNFFEGNDRVSLSENQLVIRLKKVDISKEILIKTLLIREENAGAGLRYELIHDRLVPVLQVRKQLREQRIQSEAEKQRALEQSELEKQQALLQSEIDKKLALAQSELEKQQALAQIELEKQKALAQSALEKQQDRARDRKRSFAIAVGIMTAIIIVLILITGNYYNKLIVENAGQAYQRNEHFAAFTFMQRIKWYDVRKNEKVKHFNDTSLFDISGGDYLAIADSGTVVVHQSNNVLCVWRIPNKTGDRLQIAAIIPNATNMLLSSSGRFIAYRDSAGFIHMYDKKTAKNTVVSGSRLYLLTSANPLLPQGFLQQDFKMNFVGRSSWLAYVDNANIFRLYNAESAETAAYLYKRDDADYTSGDVNHLFRYSPGNAKFDFFATKKDGGRRIKFWKMGVTGVDSLRSAKEIKVVFATTTPGVFALLGFDHNLYRYDLNVNNPKTEKVAERVDSILASKDGSKAILFLKNKLSVFDFEKNRVDERFEGKTALYKRLKRNQVLQTGSQMRWTESGAKILYIDEQVISDLDKAQSFRLYADKDQPQVNSSLYYKCILNKDESKSAYLNQHGEMVVKVLDTVGLRDTVWKWPIIAEGDAKTVGDKLKKFAGIYTLEQLCRFSNSGRYFAFINPEKKSEGLTVVDLSTGKPTIIKFPVQVLGNFFFDDYIHVLDGKSPAGGIVFLNSKPRNTDYYKALYPQINSEQEALLGIK